MIPQIDPAGTAVLNRDDPHLAALAPAAGRQVLFFGTHDQAQVRARSIRETEQGVVFELVLPTASVPVTLKTPGRFMVFNALAAAAVGHLAGIPAAEIQMGLQAFTPTKGRLQVLTTARGIRVVDDTYNANPLSMAAAIASLTAMRQEQPGIIVLGDMLELGNQAEALHYRLGAQAAGSGAVRLYVHGKYAQAVGQGAREAGMRGETVFIGSKEQISADLIRHLSSDCWVLVKGSRGMAMETVVAALREWADGSLKNKRG